MVMEVRRKAVARRADEGVSRLFVFPDVICLAEGVSDKFARATSCGNQILTVPSISSASLIGTFTFTQSFAGDLSKSTSSNPCAFSHSFTIFKLSGGGATNSSTASFDKCCP